MTGPAGAFWQDAASQPSQTGVGVAARFIHWIWHVKGSVPLAPGQSAEAAFERLDPLFQEQGTTYERTGDTLTFRKKGQPAQDRMSVFDRGQLSIRPGEGTQVLHYRLTSRALLFCFLAPLLFLAFAGLSIALATIDKPTAAEIAEQKKKAKEEELRFAKLPQNPIDKFLGAPAPPMPKDEDEKDKKAKADETAEEGGLFASLFGSGGGEEDKEEESGDHSPTPAYVFAGIFAVLYLVGRFLEPWLVRRLFRRRLQGGA